MSPKEFASNCQDEQVSEQLQELPENSGAIWPPLIIQRPHLALPFPVEVFPRELQAYCRAVAEAKLAPLDFVGASMLTVAGAAIGQSVNIAVKRDWAEAPLLFMILVAPPGSTKTPVIHAVVKPLTEIDRRLRDQARLRWEEKNDSFRRPAFRPPVESDPLSDEMPPDPPQADQPPPQLRAIVKDITRESLVIILADNPHGVLCDPDEAAGWVYSFNQYKGKGGSDRQFWLSTWSCTPVSVDRKGGREARQVMTPFVAVLGGLPPDMLTSLKEERGRNDGFMDRILFVYPERFPPQFWTDAQLSEQAERDWSEAIGRLFETPMSTEDQQQTSHRVKFTSQAKEAWVNWWDAHEHETKDPEFSDHLKGAWSKLKAHAARFALILSRLRWACDSALSTIPNEAGRDRGETSAEIDCRPFSPVDIADVEGAIKLVDFFKSHLLRVAHQVTGGIGSEESNEILEWINRNGLTSFREADVGTDLRRFRKKSKMLKDAIRFLIDAGAIRQSHESRASDTRGRKPTPAYEVRPGLFHAPDNPANSEIVLPAPSPEANCGTNGIVRGLQPIHEIEDLDNFLP